MLIWYFPNNLDLYDYVGKLPEQHCWNLLKPESQSWRNVWKNEYIIILLWSHTHSGAKISVSLKRFRICNNICKLFLGFGSYRPVFLKKSPTFRSFLFESILQLGLWNIESQFSLKLFVFLGHGKTRCALSFLWKKKFINNFYKSFNAKFGHED